MTSEDFWFVREYACDIHDYLLIKEQHRLVYKAASPQLQMRTCLIDWLAAVCEKLKFCITVQHLAVYFLDMFMDYHNIQPEHLQLVALGCLIVAMKLEEKDMLIPKMSAFNALLGNAYKLSEFVEMEITVMEFFNWDLFMPTAAHFIEYYSLHIVHPTDSYAGHPMTCLELAKKYASHYLNYFLDVSLQDPTFRQFAPSLVAASCIAGTRICLLLSPAWPCRLYNTTRYQFSQLTSCLAIMMKILDTDEVAARKGKKRNKISDEMGSEGSPSRLSDISSTQGSPL